MAETHQTEDAPIKLLVVICTYNRAHLLRQTLACLTELDRPEACTLGILVVNNCCTDNTDQVIDEFRQCLPLMSVHEGKPGLSNARNRGIQEAVAWGADYIVWTDDDVRPYPQWLTSYCQIYRAHPGAAVFGGPVEPWFEVEPPQWIRDNWHLLYYAFAVRDLGPAVAPLDPSQELPFGANFSIRTSQQAAHPFDPKLGVIKGKRLAGEETVVMQAILSGGADGWWQPAARVRHFIERERLNLHYITRYFYGAGITQAMMDTPPGRRLFGRPAWLIRAMVEEAFRLLGNLVLLRKDRWVENYIKTLVKLGRLANPAP